MYPEATMASASRLETCRRVPPDGGKCSRAGCRDVSVAPSLSQSGYELVMLPEQHRHAQAVTAGLGMLCYGCPCRVLRRWVEAPIPERSGILVDHGNGEGINRLAQ